MTNQPKFAVAFFRERSIPTKRELSETTWLRVSARLKQTLAQPLTEEEVAWLNKPIPAYSKEPRPTLPALIASAAISYPGAFEDRQEPTHKRTQAPW